MKLVDKIKRVIECPERLLIGLQLRWARYTGNLTLLVKTLYRKNMGTELTLENPKTFTEKIQWLKVYDHNPIYHTMVDKYEVKGYVAKKIGEEYIIPTLGVWERFDQIDFKNLPDKFVLKTTNGGGSTGVVICLDKSTFNIEAAKQKLEKSMAYDIFNELGEWAYWKVKPRILAEVYMSSACKLRDEIADLIDYKFFCFNGEPRYCQVIQNRNTHETIDFYDTNWIHQDFIGLNPRAKNGHHVSRPNQLDRMLDICRVLSKGIPFLRVDLYVIDEKVYFGEITFYPASGYGVISPEIWQRKLGDIIILPTDVDQSKA